MTFVGSLTDLDNLLHLVFETNLQNSVGFVDDQRFLLAR